MKNTYKNLRTFFLLSLAVFFSGMTAYAQDSTATNSETPAADQQQEEAAKPEKVKYYHAKPMKVFPSIWLIDNQTTTVPQKGTFEFDIMHRFGPAKEGYKNFVGFFSTSNIRLGFSYVPVQDLLVGFSVTRENMMWDAYAKYAIIKQSKEVNWMQFSLTWYGDIAIDGRQILKKSERGTDAGEEKLREVFPWKTARLSYFNQLILSRRFCDRFAMQIAPSWTHVNYVQGYYSDSTTISPERKWDHFAMAFGVSIMLKKNMNLMINYDQPITKHKFDNPLSNLSFGLEFATSGHAFQVFAGRYYSINPVRNNYFNQNGWKDFMIGFNITRLWNF